MSKPKIAISLDQNLLNLVDSKVDGSIIRSRSQAVEFFLRKGLQEQSISTAVLLIKGEPQGILLKEFNGSSLIKKQLDFFSGSGIKTVYIVTQHSRNINSLLAEIEKAAINVEIIEKDIKGNAKALDAIKGKLKDNFIVMSGDTYNDFDLRKMVKKHLETGKLGTIGLMSRDKPSDYGNAVLDGDLIIDFQEKPKQATSHIVNAGIYIFKKEVFELFENAGSIERDVLTKLARIKQLVGYFTMGEYRHFG